MATRRDKRLNLRVPGDLFEKFKTQTRKLHTTVTQRFVDFMMSEVRKNGRKSALNRR